MMGRIILAILILNFTFCKCKQSCVDSDKTIDVAKRKLDSLSKQPADSLSERLIKSIFPKIQLQYSVYIINNYDTINPELGSIRLININNNETVNSGCFNDEKYGCQNLVYLLPGSYRISINDSVLLNTDTILILEKNSLYKMNVFINKNTYNYILYKTYHSSK